MNIEVTDNMIIICENSYKKAILNSLTNQNTFCNVKFYTKKEFMQEYLFSFDERAAHYLVSKYNLKISIAKMYLNNLYFISNVISDNPKLQFLSNLKKDLNDQKLLRYNPLFKKYVTIK